MIESSGRAPRPVQLVARDGARAVVYTHGAHVTSWMPAGAREDRLFLSAAAELAEGKAIRGGIPVIFPQFAGMGPLPKHGFARTTAWELVRDGEIDDGSAEALFRLEDSPATRRLWPHRFVAEVRVRVHDCRLMVSLQVLNRGEEQLRFTGALHTYVRIVDVQRTTVAGLAEVRYRDSTAGEREGVQREPVLRVEGEIDRIYLGTTQPIEVRDGGRATRLSATGFGDTVIWNPGPAGSAALRDMEREGWRRMLCVEAAAIGTPVQLGPGATWTGTQSLDALS